MIEVRERLPHGQWETWIKQEFGWSHMTVHRFMQVAQAFKSNTVLDLPIDTSALYLLAAPKVPEPVRESVIERAEAGEHITKTEAERMIAVARTEAELKAFQDAADRLKATEDTIERCPVTLPAVEPTQHLRNDPVGLQPQAGGQGTGRNTGGSDPRPPADWS